MIDFKKLAHTVVKAGKSKISRLMRWRPREELVLMLKCEGSLLQHSLFEKLVFYLKFFKLVDKAHTHYKRALVLLKDC